MSFMTSDEIYGIHVKCFSVTVLNVQISQTGNFQVRHVIVNNLMRKMSTTQFFALLVIYLLKFFSLYICLFRMFFFYISHFVRL